MRSARFIAPVFLALVAVPLYAAPVFVNGLVIDATTLDASGGTTINDGRVGFFSDIYYDALRNEWYALSDRGPGGGTLPYEVRVHRFTIDIDRHAGAISNFQIRRTFIFRKGAVAFNGIAPPVGGPLGNAFDPEGIVVQPLTGTLLVSDEYRPSVYEFTRFGQFLRAYQTPANLLPRNKTTGAINYASDAGNDAGKRTNRGFEGLAIAPGGLFVFAMLQSAMLDEGGGDGVVNRIVKFNALTGRAVAQYAYVMEGSSQGRGISALVAINNHEFLVLERNNRGLGVDTNLSSPNKKVFRIDLTGATDVSKLDLDDPSATYTAVVKQSLSPWVDLAAPSTLADPSLAAMGGISPRSWKASPLVPSSLTGPISCSQDRTTTTRSRRTRARYSSRCSSTRIRRQDQSKRIQCDLGGAFANCTIINPDGTPGGAVPGGFDTTGYHQNPGVLHAYKASAADLSGFVRLQLPWLDWEFVHENIGP